MKTGITIIMAAMLTLTVAAAAEAQQHLAGPPPDEAFAPDSAGPAGAPRDAARRKIEAVRIARMTEALGLDEREVTRFIPAVSILEQQRRELFAARHSAIQEMRQELGSPAPDDAKLRASLDRLRKAQRDLVELTSKDFDTARDMLSVQQQARYVVFQQDFLREIRSIIGEMRGDMRRPGEGQRGPGMGR
jgi:Spy/CpxP family protein refolding chaperone